MVSNKYKPFLYISQNALDTNEYREEIQHFIDSKSQSNGLEISFSALMFVSILHPLALLPFGLYQLLNKRISEESSEEVAKKNLKAWKSMVLEISFDYIDDNEDIILIPEDYNPTPNKLYKQHPLKSKRNTYLPIDSYHQIIFEERESELIYILEELGALRIIIHETNHNNSELKTEVSAGFSKSASINASSLFSKGFSSVNNFQASSKSSDKEQFTRTYIKEYESKRWTPNFNFDISKYNWLNSESSWKDIVNGRLNNKLKSVEIILTNDIHNELAQLVGLNSKNELQAKLGKDSTESIGSKDVSGDAKFGLDAKVDYQRLNSLFEKHIIKVEFEIEDKSYTTHRTRTSI